MSKSQKKPNVTISGLVRSDLKEIESQLYAGRSREWSWEWFCRKHSLTITKDTFFNFLYRARKRAQKEKMKEAGLATSLSTVVINKPISPSPKEESKPHVEVVKPDKKNSPQPDTRTGQARARAAINVPVPKLDFSGGRRRR